MTLKLTDSQIRNINIIGFIFSVVVGTLLHFTYKLVNENKIVALFSAINESIWEHLKLVFFPILIFSVIGFILYGRHIEGFVFTKFLSMLLGMTTVVLLFYGYYGAFGKDYFVLDILIFILAIFFSYLFSYYSIKNEWFHNQNFDIIGILGICILMLMFFMFTIKPPNLPLFKEI